MKVKDILKKVKVLLSEVKLSQATLKDGQKIQYDGDFVDIGSVVYVLSEGGDEIVLADGSYETEDGFKFTVKDGVVDSVDDKKAEEPKEEEASTEEKLEDVPATADVNKMIETAINAALTPLWDRITALELLIKAKDEMMTSQKEALSQITQAVELLSKEPAERPATEVASNPFSKKGNKDKSMIEKLFLDGN